MYNINIYVYIHSNSGEYVSMYIDTDTCAYLYILMYKLYEYIYIGVSRGEREGEWWNLALFWLGKLMLKKTYIYIYIYTNYYLQWLKYQQFWEIQSGGRRKIPVTRNHEVDPKKMTKKITLHVPLFEIIGVSAAEWAFHLTWSQEV